MDLLAFIVEESKCLAWPVTLLIIVFLFRRPVNLIADRLLEFYLKVRGAEFHLKLAEEKAAESLPEPGDGILAVSDVQQILNTIKAIKQPIENADARMAHEWFLRNGVVTKKQVESLARDREIIDRLSRIYTSELRRPPDAPLDPVAVATWGSILYLYGIEEELLRGIRREVRRSHEYKAVHRR